MAKLQSVSEPTACLAVQLRGKVKHEQGFPFSSHLSRIDTFPNPSEWKSQRIISFLFIIAWNTIFPKAGRNSPEF